jgi:hypothetical protein
MVILWSMINLEKKQEFYTGSSYQINLIKLNLSGDRFGCVDENGDLYFFKINYQYPYYKPIYTFLANSKKLVTDFEFVNHGSIFITTNLSNKPSFQVYDTFLPSVENLSFVFNSSFLRVHRRTVHFVFRTLTCFHLP